MQKSSIMIQGTASSVGKSLICAGLCRIFRQDGYRTAPFKSQNMALNSYITKEGLEMGRAQVVQAEAAGVEPSVLMNPVLLKPTTDKRAQVVINGTAYKNMSATEYHAFKPQLSQLVLESYQKLSEDNDMIVIEGAGSPAEINLRENDIVNMGMAELVDTPVILVGDIDKGGVFAALAGTMMLLSDSERQRIKGVIINKFRGDVSLLTSGIKMLEDIIKVPVLGVVPYTRLNIDDEDSVTERFDVKRKTAQLDIVVIKLPRLSNFTDFNAFDQYPEVQVRYVGYVEELGMPDMIILPGTKNTVEDMMFLESSGLKDAIVNRNREGVVLFGICGGYQMLGQKIEDPLETESDKKEVEGLGLLPSTTIFKDEKTMTQVEGIITHEAACGLLDGLGGVSVTGYEIHMGETFMVMSDTDSTETGECENQEETDDGPSSDQKPFTVYPMVQLKTINGEAVHKTDGLNNSCHNVLGTYLHGIFDNGAFAAGLLNNLLKQKKHHTAGNEITGMDYKDVKQREYDRWAQILRDNIDMDKLNEIIRQWKKVESY